MLAPTPTQHLTAADLKDNLHDIQDNVVAPILMRYGRHIFVKFTDGAKARAWLRNMFDRVNARQEEHGTRFTVNIGFTYEGLKALGLSSGRWTASPRRSGSACGAARASWAMSDRTRRSTGRAASAVPTFTRWHWFAPIPTQGREEATRIIRAEMEATGGVEIRFVQDTMALAHENGIGSEGEHFGFADPISQPPIEGADTPSYPGDGVLEPDGTWRPLKPGEFLLGYEDEAGPDGAQAPEPFELRRNGTYVVFRKLYQDVAAFRRYLATAAKALYGSDDQLSPGAGCGQDDGPLAQRLPPRSVARQGRSRDRGGPSASQQLHVCRRRPGPAVPARLAPASQQSAGDAVEARDRGAGGTG